MNSYIVNVVDVNATLKLFNTKYLKLTKKLLSYGFK